MPLSEREQALLEQMEQALYAEDPRFAAQLASASSATGRRRRYILGAVGVLAGLGVVLLGVTQQQVWIGVLGFLIMVASGFYALATPRRRLGSVGGDGTVQQHQGRRFGRPGGRSTGGQAVGSTRSTRADRAPRVTGRAPRTQRSGSFMQRLEQRWDGRRQRGEL